MDASLPQRIEMIAPQPSFGSMDGMNSCKCRLTARKNDRWIRGKLCFLGRCRKIGGNGYRAIVYALQLELSMSVLMISTVETLLYELCLLSS